MRSSLFWDVTRRRFAVSYWRLFFLDCLTIDDGPTGCPETSVTNYRSTLCNMSEVRISVSNLICVCSSQRRNSPVEEADAVCSLPVPRYVTYWACGLYDVVHVVVGIHEEYLLRAVDADVANCAILHHSCSIVRTLKIQSNITEWNKIQRPHNTNFCHVFQTST
jgi:hypothetical protein